MTSVSIIGLGAMGSAIAQAFANAGHAVTVWNRSPGRMKPFETAGFACAADAGACIVASAVTVLCIDDYAACSAVLSAPAAESAIRGKTLVQFSTGKPQEARDAERWADARGARYLDGAILAYPREIGRDGIIFLSGKSDIYEETRPLLGALTSDLRYLGEPVGAAAGLDVALLFYYICTHLGFTQASLICESEGVGPELLAAVIADSAPSDIDEVRHLGSAIQNNDFSHPGASLGVYSNILDRVLSQANDAGIDDELPQFADRILKRGIRAGLGSEEIVSLIKLLREKRRN